MRTLIRGGMVVTMNPRREILPRADILLEGARIVEVAPGGLPGARAERVLDASERIVIPGLVNAHSHGIANLDRGRLAGRPLEIWRQYMKAVARSVSEEEIYLSVCLGAMELLRRGVTTVVDHFYAFGPVENQGAGAALRAWEDVGIRGVLAPMISDISYERTVPPLEVGADAGARAEVERISASENRETLADVEGFIRRELGRHPRIGFMLGPAAPQRCSDELLRGARRVAEELGIRLHMHVAETRTQFAHVQRTFGTSPVGRLEQVGVLYEGLTMAHGIWLTPEDIRRVAAAGASIVHNPSANMKLADGVAALPDMLDAGVALGLGTDGSGSNDAQNLWLELRAAGLMHNCRYVDYRRWPAPRVLLGMATLGSARSCGLESEVGSIEPGKQGDLVLLDRYTSSFVPLNDVEAQLVFCETGDSVDTVLVGGQVVVAGGRLVTLDERALLRRITEVYGARREEMERAMRQAEALEPTLARMYFRSMADHQGWLDAPVAWPGDGA